MDCFRDFCLACDRESLEGPYCTPACKRADLEKAKGSAPSSPTRPMAATKLTKARSSPSSSGSDNQFQYVLKPTYTQSNTHITTPFRSSTHPVQFPSSFSRGNPGQPRRQLTPSTSRSSLSSASSSSSQDLIPERARQELQEYFNSFDHARNSRRCQSNWSSR